MKAIEYFSTVIALVGINGIANVAAAACLSPTERFSELFVARTQHTLGDPQGTTTTLTDSENGLGDYNNRLRIPASSTASQTSWLLIDGAAVELEVIGPLESTEFGSTSAWPTFGLDFDLLHVASFQLTGSAELMVDVPFSSNDVTAALLGPGLTLRYSAHAVESNREQRAMLQSAERLQTHPQSGGKGDGFSEV